MTGELPTHADAFGSALADAGAAQRRRRRRAGRVVGGVVAVAAVAAGLVVLPGLRDAAGPLDVVAQARAAVAPTGGVIHYRLRHGGGMADRHGRVVDDDTPKRCRESFREEGWVADDSSGRWRLDQPATPCSTSVDGLGNATNGRRWMAVNGDTSWTFAPDSGWAVILSDVPAASRRAPMPVMAPPGSGTSAFSTATLPELLRRLLSQGKLRDTGRVAAGMPGTRVLHGRWTIERGGVRHRTTVDYIVDGETFRPRQLRMLDELRATRPGALAGVPRGRTVRIVNLTTFDLYERLPESEMTNALFRPTFPPGTEITRRTFADYARAAKRELPAASRQKVRPSPTP